MSSLKGRTVSALILLVFLFGACSDRTEPEHPVAATQPRAAPPRAREKLGDHTQASNDGKQDEKIEALLQKIANMNDAVFIRNRKEYSAKDAAEFLRFKLDKYQAKVKTADDFIREIASKSNTTGEAYHIRLKDGTTMESAEFLRKELAAINAH